MATKPAIDLCEVLAEPGDAVVPYLELGLEHWGDAGSAEARKSTAVWVAALPAGARFVGLLHAPEGLRDAAVAAGFGESNLQEDQGVELAAALGGAGTTAFVSDAAAAGWGLRERPAGTATLSVPACFDRAGAAWLAEHGLPRVSRPLLAVAVNGGSELKVWPPERVAEVLSGRLPQGQADAVLLAGPDAERAAAVQRGLPSPLPQLGVQHLLTVAAVLSRCDALLTNDSGLLHLAAAVGTPSVAVFGPTRACLYMPRVSRAGAFAGEAVEAPVSGPRGVPCPLREPSRLGPPACIRDGACSWGGVRSCVDAVPVEAVAAALGRVLGLAGEPSP